jgi:signal peptidase I
MAPLFKPGDLLCVRRSGISGICFGDVVVVHWRNETNDPAKYVVHRVISVKHDHLITQGDNNLKADLCVVTVDNLIGLVTAFNRQNHIYTVRGGYLGLSYARIIYVRNYIWLIIKRLGWRVYRLIHQSGWIAKAWRPTISQIRVMTDNGPLIKYFYGNRTVARWWPKIKKFVVNKPFDLVIPYPEELK